MFSIKRCALIFFVAGSVATFALAGVDVSMWRMDKAGYPKAFAAWGAAGFRKINDLMEPAAELVRRSKDCVSLEGIGLSDQRSDSKSKKVAFFVDCRAKGQSMAFTRFYVSEADIQAGRVPDSDKAGAEATSDAQMKGACVASARTKTRNPATMKLYPASDRVERSSVALGNAIATIPFDAAELTFKAVCYFNGGKLAETNIEPR
ncbi:hypothetical protein [Variovorax gossypii]